MKVNESSSTASDRLFLEERLERILAWLHERGRASVAELSQQFNVSTVTIRHDLTTLEQQGLLVRTHGGAMLKPNAGTDLPAFALRKELHQAEKQRIGQAAADLVGDALMQNIVRVWLETEFEGGRHLRRVEKIIAYEREHSNALSPEVGVPQRRSLAASEPREETRPPISAG